MEFFGDASMVLVGVAIAWGLVLLVSEIIGQRPPETPRHREPPYPTPKVYTARCVVLPAGSPHAADLIEAGYQCCPMPEAALRLYYLPPAPSVASVYEIHDRVVTAGERLLPAWRLSFQACELMATGCRTVLVDPASDIPTMHDLGDYSEPLTTEENAP